MRHLLSAGIATAAMILPVVASAATITAIDTYQELGSVDLIGPNDVGGYTVDFDWNTQSTGDAAVYLDFNAVGPFELLFTDYTPDQTASASTGFIFMNLATNMTYSWNTCTAQGVFEGADCTLITGAPGGAPNAISPEESFGIFESGNYRIGIYEEDNSPVIGDAEFRLNPVPVPVPAGGLLLLTALGGFAALRRRKSANT